MEFTTDKPLFIYVGVARLSIAITSNSPESGKINYLEDFGKFYRLCSLIESDITAIHISTSTYRFRYKPLRFMV